MKQENSPTLGRRASLGLIISISTVKTVNNNGIPWAKRKYIKKLLKLDLLFLQIQIILVVGHSAVETGSHLTIFIADNDLAMLNAMADIQKKNAMKV